MVSITDNTDHAAYMAEAIREAEAALGRGDRPIGCVIVHGQQIVGRGSNHEFTLHSKLEHAESRAMRSCAPCLYEHSDECIVYTTLAPCVMCLGMIVMANIRHVVYGADDPGGGRRDVPPGGLCASVDPRVLHGQHPCGRMPAITGRVRGAPRGVLRRAFAIVAGAGGRRARITLT